MKPKNYLNAKHKKEKPKYTESNRGIPHGLKVKLNSYFKKQPTSYYSMTYYKIVDNIKRINYEYQKTAASDGQLVFFMDSLEYCFHKHNRKIVNNSKVSYESFKLNIKLFGYKRIIAGVILVNKQKEFLCVIAPDGRITFPIGKEDQEDLGNSKLTGFRELGEETGVWLSDEDYQKANRYIEVCITGKLARFYLIEEFTSKVDLNYQRTNEVVGLIWLHPSSILRDTISSEMLLTKKKYKFDEYVFTSMLKDMSLLIDTNRNPFYSLGCQRNTEAEVFQDTCDYIQDYTLVKLKNKMLKKH